jgi:hypothetical protein
VKTKLVLILIIFLFGLLFVGLNPKFTLSEPTFTDLFYNVYKKHDLDQYPILYVTSPDFKNIDLPNNIKIIGPQEKQYPHLSVGAFGTLDLPRSSVEYSFAVEKRPKKEFELSLPLEVLHVEKLTIGWRINKIQVGIKRDLIFSRFN